MNQPGARSRRFGQVGMPRLLAMASLLMMLVASLAGPTVADAQDGGRPADDTYVEVALLECDGPAGDPATECATPVSGATVDLLSTAKFTVDSKTTTDEPNGNILRFSNFPGGNFDLALNLSNASVDPNAASQLTCTDGATGELVVDPEASNTSFMTIRDGEGLMCTWNIFPPDEAGAQGDGDAQDDVGAPGEEASDLGSIEVQVAACDPDTEVVGDTAEERRDFLNEACPEPLNDVSFTFVNTATGEETTDVPDETGALSYPGLEPALYTLASDIPSDVAEERLFCDSADAPNPYEKEFSDGVTDYNLTAEQVECSWFVFLDGQQPEPPADDLARIDLDTIVCQPGLVDNISGYDELIAACEASEQPLEQEFTLTPVEGGEAQAIIAPVQEDGQVSFPGIEPGEYFLTSGIPDGSAHEAAFCTADGGDQYQKQFDPETGATTFDLTTEQIACEWFVLPFEEQPDPPEDALTHLEVNAWMCPEGYEGDDFANDCREEGADGQLFTLSGETLSDDLTIETWLQDGTGPGRANFTELPVGDYTLSGGPDVDDATAVIDCSIQPNGDPFQATLEGSVAALQFAGEGHVLCQWYIVPGDDGAVDPPAERAEIFVTMLGCPEAAEGAWAGASFNELAEACTEPINDVNFTLSGDGMTPLNAETGLSGDGAVRFYELPPGDYTLDPALPESLTNAAVFCQLDDGDVYQKALQGGATTFSGVETHSIACSWFVAPPQEAPEGPSGTITLREYACEGDREDIEDWDRECVAADTGGEYSLTSTDGSIALEGASNENGVLVFYELPDGIYELERDNDTWCRATADRVDGQGRLLVRDGGNNDVFLYSCDTSVTELPSTGVGPQAQATAGENGLPATTIAGVMLAALLIPAATVGIINYNRRRNMPTADHVAHTPVMTERGTAWMRFK